MPRGAYNVQNGMDVETGKQAQRDSSYRACLHAMLIFIAICIILLVAAWPWHNHRANGAGKSSNHTDPSSAAVKGEEDHHTTSRSTGVQSTTTPKPTTFLFARNNPNTVIPVEETEEPPLVTTTTQRTTRSTRPVLTNKRLDIGTSTSTTTSTSTSTTPTTTQQNNHGILVNDDQETDSTPQSVATTQDDASEGNDVIIEVPTTTTTVADPSEEANVDGDVTPAGVTTVTTTITQDPITEVPGDDEGTVIPTSTTEDTNLEVEVFSTRSEEDEDEQGHYESSTSGSTQADTTDPPPLEQTDVTEAVQETTSVADNSEVMTVPSFTSPGSGLVCQTSHCKALATRMLSLMNHSVDPCDDFYEHACGGLRSNPSLLGDDPTKDVYERIKRGLNNIVDSSCQAHKTFQRYYESCVQFDSVITEEQRIAEARKIIDKVGQFNDIDNVNPVLIDLTSLVIKLMQYHSTPLFDLMLDVDGHNPTQFALKLTAPVFKPMFRPFDRREDCLKGRDTTSDLNAFYNGYITCKKEEHEIYLKELNDTIRVLKIPISASTITDIKQNMEFELLSLIEHLPSAGAMQQSLTGKDYVEMSIEDLTHTYPKVEWRTLIKALLNRDLPDDTLVQVYFKDYLDNMIGNFTALDESKQQNVLLAWFAHDVYVDLVLTRDSCSRDAYCLRVASDLMEETAASLYLSTFKPETLQGMRTEAQQVFMQLQLTLEKQLYDAEWLGESSKSAAVSKLKNLKLTVDGGVSVFLNETFLNDRMKQITQKDNNYITLSAALLKRYRRQMYSLYGANPSDPQAMWSHFLLPHSTQGIVVYALKNVVIPYGLMTYPMYEPGLPRYLLMARLGFVIAHEMAHHFDVIGMTYGTNGRGDSLLSFTPSATFRDKTNCLKDSTSFSGTKMADDGRAITYRANESLSLNERIADRTAAVLGYETYLSWVREHGEPAQLPYLRLTNNEIYFMAIAQIFCSKSSILDYGVTLFEDEHLPPFLRVNTIMDNSHEFANVFQCKVGVDMNRNPDDKCEAFPKLTAGGDTEITPDDSY